MPSPQRAPWLGSLRSSKFRSLIPQFPFRRQRFPIFPPQSHASSFLPAPDWLFSFLSLLLLTFLLCLFVFYTHRSAISFIRFIVTLCPSRRTASITVACAFIQLAVDGYWYSLNHLSSMDHWAPVLSSSFLSEYYQFCLMVSSVVLR